MTSYTQSSVYTCVFSFRMETFSVESTEGIGVFKDGFWVTKNMDFTKGTDCKYWIPPAAILYVRKEIEFPGEQIK